MADVADVADMADMADVADVADVAYVAYVAVVAPGGATGYSSNHGHQVAPLVIVPDLATRWRY